MEKLRIIVLADMPEATRHERKVARIFRVHLFKDGFTELQVGVFTRVVDGRSNANLHVKRLRDNRPETGPVRVLTLTEKQFRDSELLAGDESPQELEIGSQLDIFL